MTTVGEVDHVAVAPRARPFVDRRVILAGIWGLLVSLVGFGAVIGFDAMNPPPLGGSPEGNWGRGLMLELTAIFLLGRTKAGKAA